jgi:hypothetical protein
MILPWMTNVAPSEPPAPRMCAVTVLFDNGKGMHIVFPNDDPRAGVLQSKGGCCYADLLECEHRGLTVDVELTLRPRHLNTG